MTQDSQENEDIADEAATFATVATERSDWLVLRCASSKTIALAKSFADDLGAWTPTWKRQRRLPRSNVKRLVDEPCIPSFVFVPAERIVELPTPTQHRIGFSLMKIDGVLVRIPDKSLDHLRHIAQKPKIPAKDLPKPGTKVRFSESPFEGLRGKILRCSQRYATVEIDGYPLPVQVPPSLCQKSG